MTDCLIQGNDAAGGSGLGGGIYASSSDVTFTNVIVADNTTSGFFGLGGGMYCAFSPSPTLENCTFDHNSCGGGGNGGGIAADWLAVPEITRCIISFSDIGEGLYCNNSAVPAVSCTDVYGNAGGDALCGKDNGGNFSGHPRYCETPGIEYHLAENSPCAPGNHPGGPAACNGELIGAKPVSCGFTGTDEAPVLHTKLLGASPNPFNPQTRIFFVLGEAGPATLRIYDARGQVVKTMPLGHLAAGEHNVLWDGRDGSGRFVASGVYFSELTTFSVKQTQRMALIR
jgi:hypothetical protein